MNCKGGWVNFAFGKVFKGIVSMEVGTILRFDCFQRNFRGGWGISRGSCLLKNFEMGGFSRNFNVVGAISRLGHF